MFTSETKEALIKAGLQEEVNNFVQYLKEYDCRYIRTIKPQAQRPERLLGQNGLHYIQLALFRSKTLLRGSIESLNNNNALLAILSARAHFEVTGGLAYFYKKLKNFYDEIISYEQLDESLRRLTLGARIEELTKAPDPISVMSLIDAADDFFKNKIPEKVSMYRESYEYLSEFCHLNCFGITMGCEINNVGIVRYNDKAVLTEKDFVFVHYILMSCSSFFRFYDMLYEMLSSKEELPIIIK